MLTKIHTVKNMFFSSSHVQIWELNNKEGWTLKNLFFWIVVLEKALDSPFYNKEIKPVNPKGNQCGAFTGRTGAKVEAPILWPPDVMSQLIEKDPDVGKIEGRRRRERHMRWLDGITDSMCMSLSKSRRQWGIGKPDRLQSMESQRVKHYLAIEQQWKHVNSDFYFAAFKILVW